MSPRVMGAELPDKPARQVQRSHPGHDPSDAPGPMAGQLEASTEVQSQAAQVAEFRSSKIAVSVPAAVIVALITAVSGFGIAWANKPAAVALTPEQDRKLSQCAELGPRLEKVESYMRWIEPQIGVILVRLDSRPYVPPPPTDDARRINDALTGRKP